MAPAATLGNRLNKLGLYSRQSSARDKWKAAPNPRLAVKLCISKFRITKLYFGGRLRIKMYNSFYLTARLARAANYKIRQIGRNLCVLHTITCNHLASRLGD